MKIAPEFFAIGIWCLFVAAITVAGEREHAPNPALAQSKIAQSILAQSMGGFAAVGNAPGDALVTGRSSAKENNGPYGNLFIDPSLQDGAPVRTGPKPTSADLTAQ
jgi:hypothetical protein